MAARACQRLKGFHGVPMVAIAQLEFHVPAPHPLRQAVVLGKPHLGLQQPDLANKYGFEQVDKPKLQSSESQWTSYSSVLSSQFWHNPISPWHHNRYNRAFDGFALATLRRLRRFSSLLKLPSPPLALATS